MSKRRNQTTGGPKPAKTVISRAPQLPPLSLDEGLAFRALIDGKTRAESLDGVFNNILDKTTDDEAYQILRLVLQRLALPDALPYSREAHSRNQLELENMEMKAKLLQQDGVEIPPLGGETDALIPAGEKTFTLDQVGQIIQLVRIEEYAFFASFAQNEYDPVTANIIETQGLLKYLSGISGIGQSGVFRAALRAYPTPGGISLDEFLGVLGLRSAKQGVIWETDVSQTTNMLKELAGRTAAVLNAAAEDTTPDQLLRQSIAKYTPFIADIDKARKANIGGRPVSSDKDVRAWLKHELMKWHGESPSRLAANEAMIGDLRARANWLKGLELAGYRWLEEGSSDPFGTLWRDIDRQKKRTKAS